MSDIKRRPEAETEYRTHLQRGEPVWNRLINWYWLSGEDFEPIRTGLIVRLGLSSGNRVLVIGCGPGVNVRPVRDRIGDDGHLVAIDYSPEMIANARERIATNGCEEITVRHANATTADLGDPYEAAIATLPLSVMPEVG